MTIDITTLIDCIEDAKESICVYSSSGGEDSYVNVVDADKLLKELFRIKHNQERFQ